MKNIENELLVDYLKSFPEQSASMLDELSDTEVFDAIGDLPEMNISDVINRMKPERACNLLLSLPDKTFKQVYMILDPIRVAHLLSLAPKDERDLKSKMLSEVERRDLAELLSYPQDSAGSIMDTRLKTCKPGDSVKGVIASFRKFRAASREIFVTNLNGELVGYLPIQDLLFSDDKLIIESVMHKSPPSVNALAPKSDVTETFETFKTTVLPVTHVDGTLLGAIRYASLINEVQNQAVSSMASLGGASPSERALSPPLFSVSKRLPWLLVNLLTAFIASSIVGIFEGTIAKVTALAVLLPVVAGQSGNTGAQAMAVTMRGLALREVRTRQWPKILFKELRVGFLNGLTIAIVTGISVYFWSKSMPLGLVMTVAMTFSMIIASIAGAAIPVVLTSMGRDPAQSSSVILTTVTDVMGFLSFLGLATIFVSLLLD